MHEQALDYSPARPAADALACRLAEVSRAQAVDAGCAAEQRGPVADDPEYRAGCTAFKAGERAWQRQAFHDAASAWGWSAGAFLRAARRPVTVALELPLPAPVPPRGPMPEGARSPATGPLVVVGLFAVGAFFVARNAPALSTAVPPPAVRPSVAIEAPPTAVAAPEMSPVLPDPLPPPEVAARPDDAPPVVADRALGDWLRRYAVAWGQRDVLTLQRLGVLTARVEADRLSAIPAGGAPLRATVRNVTSRVVGKRTIVSFDRTLIAPRAAPISDHLTFVLEPGLRGLTAFVPGRDEGPLARLGVPRG